MAWIIKKNGERDMYVSHIETSPDNTREDVKYRDREGAKRFETKKIAQEFKDEFSITGSIIPA